MAETVFGTKVRGYDKEEVDAYIKKLHSEYAEVCAHLQEKITKLEASLEQQEEIAKAFVRAEEIMRQTLDEATEKAEKAAEESKLKVEHILAETKSKEMQILGAARIKADEMLAAAEAKAKSITTVAEVEFERARQQAYHSRAEVREKMQQVLSIASLYLKETEEAQVTEESPSNEKVININEYKDSDYSDYLDSENEDDGTTYTSISN